MRTPLPALKRFLGLVGFLWMASAQAWPAEMYFDVGVGERRFERLQAAEVEVENPEIATAELLPSGELFVEGKAPGRTLLLVINEGRYGVWRIRVSPKGRRPEEPPSDDALESARKVCPLQLEKDDDGPRLTAQVKNETCRRALLVLFQTDAFRARALELTYEVQALQAQLADIHEAFRAAGVGGLGARYVGAGLVLTGVATPKEHRRALWELFRHSAGRVAIEDRVEASPTQSP